MNRTDSADPGRLLPAHSRAGNAGAGKGIDAALGYACLRGRNLARVTSSVTSSNSTSTGIPIWSWSGGMSTTQVAIRTPSSSSTITVAYGTASANWGSIGWVVVDQLNTFPLPADLAHW